MRFKHYGNYAFMLVAIAFCKLTAANEKSGRQRICAGC
jgi:hypothetical protein